MRLWLYIIGLALISCLLCACKQKKGEEEKLSVAVIPKGTTHVFWKSIQAGAMKCGQEMGVDVIWVGPEKEDDRQQQIALVDNQVMNQVSGIILAPLDEMALRRPVRDAVRKGVPVVIIDSGLKDSEEIYTSFIATDNREGGRIGGRELGNMLGGKGNVIVLRFVEGSASTENRAEGFLEAINKFPDITVVSQEQYAGATKAQAQQASENFLLRFMDETGSLTIDGIFCTNESTTYGMLQALKRKRLAGKVKFVGFDSSPPLVEGLKQGEIHGLVVQNPFKMAYLGVKTMVSHLRGQTVENYIDTGVTFVTVDNLKNPDIQEIIYPDLEKWLGQ
jgi:ribose transport system substrate-binding protein